MSPWSALPPHINSPEEWGGKDDDKHFYTKWRKRVKGWFAYGPRATEWWARWREYPVMLFAMRGKGHWRYEDDFGIWAGNPMVRGMFWDDHRRSYLSRCQKLTSWSVQLQWPLFFGCHVTIRGQVWQFYIGAKKDTDCYWFPAIFLGRGWK